MRILTKNELKKLKKTKLGGTDGDLYISPSCDRILKVLHNFKLYGGIGGKKRLLNYLVREKELEKVIAIPKEIVSVSYKKTIAFWMKYFSTGVRLDDWTKQNQNSPKKVLAMYREISKIVTSLHENYGIIVSDCYYTNILIVNDKFPIFVDADSFSMDGIESYTISKIVLEYSKKQYWNRYQQSAFISSKNIDMVALWLMYFEAVLKLPVRSLKVQKFSDYVKKREDIEPITKEIICMIGMLTDTIPCFHEITNQYILQK